MRTFNFPYLNLTTHSLKERRLDCDWLLKQWLTGSKDTN